MHAFIASQAEGGGKGFPGQVTAVIVGSHGHFLAMDVGCRPHLL